jgi:hypothetical protein
MKSGGWLLQKLSSTRYSEIVFYVLTVVLEQHLANQALHSRRLRIEHVNSSVKRCRIVKDRIRLWKKGIRDVVMEICCALHNFRVRLTPWQPMI